jgi:hypothetical protein
MPHLILLKINPQRTYAAASFDGSAIERQLKLHNRIPHRSKYLGHRLVPFMLTGGNNGVPRVQRGQCAVVPLAAPAAR